MIAARSDRENFYKKSFKINLLFSENAGMFQIAASGLDAGKARIRCDGYCASLATPENLPEPQASSHSTPTKVAKPFPVSTTRSNRFIDAFHTGRGQTFLMWIVLFSWWKAMALH